MSEFCDERHGNCEKRMDSHAEDIREVFRTKASNRTLFWTLGILFILICGSYTYTKTVADDVSEIVTKGDMKEYQKAIIEAIKEGR